MSEQRHVMLTAIGGFLLGYTFERLLSKFDRRGAPSLEAAKAAVEFQPVVS